MTILESGPSTRPLLSDMPDGKRRLLQAAMELAAEGRTISSMGLRELARAADLNPNTFYRHFDDLDDLGRAIGAVVTRSLMADLREVRVRASEYDDVTRAVVDHYLAAVAADPGPYRIGLNELHGPSASMRAMVRQLLDGLAEESVAQLQETGLTGGLPDEVLHGVARVLTRTMFSAAGDLLERPHARDEIADQLTTTIRWVFAGAATTA